MHLKSTSLLFLIGCIISISITHASTLLWEGSMEPNQFIKSWGLANSTIGGRANGTLVSCDSPSGRCFRVGFPAGTYDPGSMTRLGKPIGGMGFVTSAGIAPKERLHLRYFIKFADDFQYVRGGKLPGLFGGTGNSGGAIPTGYDGFSARLMWRENGTYEVYAYLPTSKKYGTSFPAVGKRFIPGRWTMIEIQLTLNTPSIPDGTIRLWVDEELVVDEKNITFRATQALQVNGLIFSTFFGGGDPSWATPIDTHIDFADFAIGTEYIGRPRKAVNGR